jgi:hypothetical protein
MTHLLIFDVPMASPHSYRAIATYQQIMPLEKE